MNESARLAGRDDRKGTPVRTLIEHVPIPIAGVALGLAALGNLLAPAAEAAHMACGALSTALVALLIAKIVLFPAQIRDDMRNSILASVSATLFMTLMQLSAYLAPLAYPPAFALWAFAVVAHLALMMGFTVRFMARFELREVFPTYFICYVGIIVASATSPAFGMEAVGHALFWMGFALYLVMLALVTYRYAKHEIPEPARPLFCIYTAPASLSIVGYLATAAEPDPLFVGILLVLAQALFLIVLARLPQLLRLRFYPSFAAMTFPFVITATALGQAAAFLEAAADALPAFLPALADALIAVETGIAVALVAYVLARYAVFLLGHLALPARGAAGESALLARLAGRFEREHADAQPAEAVAGDVTPRFPARGPVSAYALRHPR